MKILIDSPKAAFSGNDLKFFRPDFIDGDRMQESAGFNIIRRDISGCKKAPEQYAGRGLLLFYEKESI